MARHYRTEVPKTSMDAFRAKIIASKATGQNPPVVIIEGTTFCYIRHLSLYVIAATRSNPNAVLMFEYLNQIKKILQSYLADDFNDETIQNNFSLLFELFDETMDYGYPQICAIDTLRVYINVDGALPVTTAAGAGSLTSQITGAIDWRREGLRYRRNEVHIDVHETVSILTSQTGQILRADIHGKVLMKTQLTGMPECKFGLNDKLIMEKEGAGGAAASSKASVEIDDCTFHRCVRLGKFDSERTITFIPPDGEFELMKYRMTTTSQPFQLSPTITEEREDGKNKLKVNLKVKANFVEDKTATNVVIKIPMPNTAATARITKATRASYDAGQRAIVWRIPSFPGGTELFLDAVVDLLPATREKAWVRPPISMDFSISMYSVSGVQVRFLKVYEKSNYQTQRWVRYLSKAGEYQIRI